MLERAQFIADYERGDDTVVELALRYGISRKTAYKWITRFEEEGEDGLLERSRAPHTIRHSIGENLEARILKVRDTHPTWGPRKIQAWLALNNPSLKLCAASTIGDLLKRRGIANGRRRKRRCSPSARPFGAIEQSNQTWCADFKGWFWCGSTKCYPLTITDAYSRYLIRCQAMAGFTGFEAVKPLFEAAFREFGLPAKIRTDNGSPFATTGLGGLSALSAWWMTLGIIPERIQPGKPAQNGRHERMHLTLKQETASPPRTTIRAQQRRFDEWREEYNQVRPHEALGQKPPSHFHAESNGWNGRIEPHQYTDEMDELRRVKPSGQIKWGGKVVQLAHALRGQQVGLKHLGGQYWQIYFRELELGILDEKELRILSGKTAQRLLNRLARLRT